MYKVRLIASQDEFAQAACGWNELLSISPADNYFLRWEWLWNWWQVFAKKGDRLAIMALEKDGETAAIAPCYIRKRDLRGVLPSRLLMFLGTQDEGEGDVGSDYMDMIYREGEEADVVAAVFEYITGHDLCDEIFFSKMDVSSKSFPLIMDEATRLGFLTQVPNEYTSPYINLPARWEDYLDGLSTSMRHKIRKERRRLSGAGHAVFKKAESDEDLKTGLHELIRLHQGRWNSKGIEGAFSNDKFTRFHEAVMPCMMENGQLDLVLLSEDGRYRGAVYNIVYKNKIYFYQSGIDVGNGLASYGFALHSHCIEEAIRDGLDEYDFLPKGKTDSYKDRYANQQRNVSDIYIACSRLIKYLVTAKQGLISVYRHIKPHRTA